MSHDTEAGEAATFMALAPEVRQRMWGAVAGDTERRYQWLADTVLACDYGDNGHPDKLIGWRVMEFISPVAYGPSIDAAIDVAMEAEAEHRRMRSMRTAELHAKPLEANPAPDVAEAVRQDETTDRRVRASSAGGEEK